MATTPEGRIKNKIKAVLDKHYTRVYYYMPVPGGYGRATLDYLGCANGWFFGIEAKRPGKVPTSRQEGTIEDMENAGGKVFRINSDETVAEFDAWLAEVCA
jgi:hypothetical protein